MVGVKLQVMKIFQEREDRASRVQQMCMQRSVITQMLDSTGATHVQPASQSLGVQCLKKQGLVTHTSPRLMVPVGQE